MRLLGRRLGRRGPGRRPRRAGRALHDHPRGRQAGGRRGVPGPPAGRGRAGPEPMLTRSVVKRDRAGAAGCSPRRRWCERATAAPLVVNIIEDVTRGQARPSCASASSRRPGRCWRPRSTTSTTLRAGRPRSRCRGSPTGARSTCPTSDGVLQQVALAHVDPRRSRWRERMRERYPPEPDETTGVPAVIRTGRAELYSDIPDELLDAGRSHDPEQRRADPRRSGMRSAMIVPMRGRASACSARSRSSPPRAAAASTRPTSRSPRTLALRAPRPRSRTRACTPSATRIAHTLQAQPAPRRACRSSPAGTSPRVLPGGRARQRRRRRLLRRRSTGRGRRHGRARRRDRARASTRPR